jgi:hypothetical protein
MEKLKLRKPIEIDGKTVNEIEYDFESVTGSDIEKVCKSLVPEGYVVLAQETDPVLHAHIFAEAAGIDYKDMLRFSGKDYTKATNLVRDFFYLE